MEEKIKEIARTTTMTTDEVAGALMSQAEKGLPLNLQFFSEKENTEDVETTENTQEEEQENTTFTRSDVDREVSKAVQSALDKREAKHKEEMQKAIENAIAEKERLSKLSEKEREKEKLTQREKDLEKRTAALERKELLSDAESILREKGLSTSFANVLLGDDAEKTLDNINNFKFAFDEAVNNQVKEKLRQETPPASGGNINTNKSYNIAEMARNARVIK